MGIIRTDGIICTVRSHGEHGGIVRIFTPDHGLMAGYVRGAKSRAKRPILMPANIVSAVFRSRTAEQLAGVECELRESRAPLYDEPLAAAAFQWGTLLTASVLPEEQAYPQIYSAFSALLDAVAAAPSARGWAAGLVRYELLLLSHMGFGLDLRTCVVTETAGDLRYVSPKSGRAVSGAGAQGRETLLFPLPSFLIAPDTPDWPDLFDGLRLTGHFYRAAFLSGLPYRLFLCP